MKVKNDHRSKFSSLSNWKEEAWTKKKSGLQRDSNPGPELWSHTLGVRSIYWVHISREETTAVQKWIISYILLIISLLTGDIKKKLKKRGEKENGEGEGRRVGGYSIKLCSERLRLKVQCLTHKYTIFDKSYSFRVSSIKKLYPFHISASWE